MQAKHLVRSPYEGRDYFAHAVSATTVTPYPPEFPVPSLPHGEAVDGLLVSPTRRIRDAQHLATATQKMIDGWSQPEGIN